MEVRRPLHRASTTEIRKGGDGERFLRSAKLGHAYWSSLPPGPSALDRLILPHFTAI